MCNKRYIAQPGETVFEVLGMSPHFYFIFLVLGIIMFILGAAFSYYFYYSAAGYIVFGILFLIRSGENWFVFIGDEDQLFIVNGYVLNYVFRRSEPYKLSQLTSLHVKRTVPTTTNLGQTTQLMAHFTDGTALVVASDPSQAAVCKAVAEVKAWLEKNRPNLQVRFEDGNEVISTLVVVNSGQKEELELRGVIIQYQMSSDWNAQSKAQKLTLALECNKDSMVNTYVAVKQQFPVYTSGSEDVLLKTAQTIIDARNYTTPSPLIVTSEVPTFTSEEQTFTNEGQTSQ